MHIFFCFNMYASQSTMWKLLIGKGQVILASCCSKFHCIRLKDNLGKQKKGYFFWMLASRQRNTWHGHSSDTSSHVCCHSTRISRQNTRSASEQPTAGQGSVWGRERRRVRQGGSNLSHRDSSASIGVPGLKEWGKCERKVLICDYHIYILRNNYLGTSCY